MCLPTNRTIVALLAHAVVGATLCCATSVVADDLIYFEEDGGSGQVRGLYTLDPLTGIATFRAPVGGGERFFSMAQQPDTGTVFAVSVPGNTGLWTIDVDTGTTTLVGSTGIQTAADITFHPSTGAMIAIERNVPYRMYQIDPGTAVATLISTSNEDVRSGLQYDAAGTLFGCSLNGVLSTVDLLSGSTNPIGGGGTPSVLEDATFTSSGELFITTFNGNVYRINPNTGANSFVHSTGMGNGLVGIVAVSDRCYADCDGNGSLNILDYICFGDDFAAGGSYADCDGNGSLNILDYICYGDAFAAGCP